jgi:hypothetical protein
VAALGKEVLHRRRESGEERLIASIPTTWLLLSEEELS